MVTGFHFWSARRTAPEIARDLDIDANVLTFDWASNESVLGYNQDVLQDTSVDKSSRGSAGDNKRRS